MRPFPNARTPAELRAAIAASLTEPPDVFKLHNAVADGKRHALRLGDTTLWHIFHDIEVGLMQLPCGKDLGSRTSHP